MTTRLTLDLEDELVERVNSFSEQTGTPVSRVVADLIEGLPRRSSPRIARPPDASGLPPILHLTPKVRSLVGILKDSGVDEKDYRQYLEEKYR